MSTLVPGLREHADVAVDATSVYLLAHDAEGGKITKLPVAGGAAFTLATGLRNPRSLAVDGTSVYWTEYNFGTVMKVPNAGGAPITLASSETPDAIATDGVMVYWLGGNENTVLSVPVGGGTPVPLLATQFGPLGHLAVNAQGIFWTTADSCNGMIMKLTAR